MRSLQGYLGRKGEGGCLEALQDSVVWRVGVLAAVGGADILEGLAKVVVCGVGGGVGDPVAGGAGRG